jgi:hypothetical protein
MSRRSLVPALIGALALLIPATAAAKGPSEATITGPGLRAPIKFSGDGESGPTNSLGQLVEWGGFFPQAFGQSPSPLLAGQPKTALGPRYDVTYVVPGPSTDTLRQVLYPYATYGPVTYMAPGQKLWSLSSHGGWYRGNRELKSTLIEAGLPKNAPATHHRDASGRRAIAVGAGAGILFAGGALLLLRRRRR